jgi:hypothetical protein
MPAFTFFVELLHVKNYEICIHLLPDMNENPYDAQIFSELFDVQPQAMIWLKPVMDEQQQVVDFEFSYCNEEGFKYLNIGPDQPHQMRLSTTTTATEELRARFFNEMLTVYQTGQKMESDFFNPALNKYAGPYRGSTRHQTTGGANPATAGTKKPFGQHPGTFTRWHFGYGGHPR